MLVDGASADQKSLRLAEGNLVATHKARSTTVWAFPVDCLAGLSICLASVDSLGVLWGGGELGGGEGEGGKEGRGLRGGMKGVGGWEGARAARGRKN